MFEDEYDLALAIMDGMEARSVKGGYALERFKFNSTWLLNGLAKTSAIEPIWHIVLEWSKVVAKTDLRVRALFRIQL